MDAVLVTPRCADPLYRRSVKVSMGAVFSVPWTRLASWPADIAVLREAGFAVLALTPDADGAADRRAGTAKCGHTPRWSSAPRDPGLAPSTLVEVRTRVRIPMSAGVDSLNVGAAAAVACYALTR